MVAVRLISHASVLIDAGATRILTDPWWLGRCFNDSWALIAPPAEIDLAGIDYLWLSHEHPDHFNISTLRSLPQRFRERVIVLFQQSSDHPKMVRALHKLGFEHVQLLPHKRWVRIGDVEILCYQSRQIDSALAVRRDGATVLNLNDCDFGPKDWEAICELTGPPDILLNQFSLAGFDGVEEDLPAIAGRILDDVVMAHRALRAKVTIPFASFAYFCCQDNSFINRHANTPRLLADRFEAEQLDLAVLRPGDVFAGGPIDNAGPLAWWDEAYGSIAARTLRGDDAVALAEIQEAFHRRCVRLRDYHGSWTMLLRPIVVDADTLGRLRIDFRRSTLEPAAEPPDVKLGPQPLLFLLQHDFGMQTLGVSGRYRLLRKTRNWMAHRILLAMVNAGIGLSWKKLARAGQLSFFWARRADLFRQLLHTLRRA